MTDIPPTLMGLVQQYSPTGQEKPAVEWLVHRMMETGFDNAYRDPAGNAAGIMGNGSNQIVLLGHIDTVPGEIPIHVSEGVLYGRGSVDAKGPLAAFVDAVAGSQINGDWQIVVIGAVDEEGNSTGARSITDLYHPRYAIIGEPSQWSRITLAYKGIQRTRITCSLPVEHSSQGGSAADQLVQAWKLLLEQVAIFNDGKSMANQIIPTIVNMTSDTTPFTVQASFEVSTRLPQDVSPHDWMVNWLGQLEDLEVEPNGEGIPAFRADTHTSLVRAFQGAIREAGEKPGFVSKSGTADMNIVAPIWQCPVAAYGPGDSNLDHTPNEHLDVGEYNKAVIILKNVLKRLGIIDN